jgi:type IX secretion system PorP/SprF family membrane protein
MKKVLLSISIAFALITTVSAQDEAIFNHYLVNPMIINPAYTGFNDNIQLFGHYRAQWTGFPGAPKTYAVTANIPVTNKVGLGGLLLSEKFGTMDRQRYQLNYAYRYASKRYKWGIGFSTEFHRSRLDASVMENQFYESGDQLVEDRVKGLTFFDASLGGYAVIDDKIIASLSFPNLIRQRLGQVDPNAKAQRTTFKQFILMGGYKLKKNQISLEPSIVVRKVYQAPFEVDVNAKAGFMDDKIIAGLTVRPGTSGQIGLLVGVKQTAFEIYYSYNSALAELKSYNRTAHEVSVAVNISKPSKEVQRGKRYRN